MLCKKSFHSLPLSHHPRRIAQCFSCKVPRCDEDEVSKVFIATDSSSLDPQAYERCADMIDVVIDVSAASMVLKQSLVKNFEVPRKR